MRLLCLSICCLLLAACASAPHPPTSRRHQAAERESAARLEELIAAEKELSQQQLGAVPSCERVCPFVENIRRLSNMICELAQRHSDDEILAANCRDAELRATRARKRAPSSCSCAR